MVLKSVSVVAGLLAAASVATWLRYGSLNPCDWMEQDRVERSGLPAMVVQAEIAARFLLDGITDPQPLDCLPAWWEQRAEQIPEAQ